MPSLYVVIPNYNGEEHLNLCLTSLRNQTFADLKTIIVDNNSKDNSNTLIKNNFPEVTLIELDFNSGFAAGVNVGIKAAMKDPDMRFILLLNNDIECRADFAEKFISGIGTETSIGSAACKMMNFYERSIIDDAGDFIKKEALLFKEEMEKKTQGSTIKWS